MRQVNNTRQDSLIRPDDLESIDDTLYEPKLGELVARRLFELKTNDPDYSNEIGYDKLGSEGLASTGVSTYDGAAQVTHSEADDIPLVELSTTRTKQDVIPMAVGFRLTNDEIREARATGQPVDTAKATRARRVMGEYEAHLLFYGESDVNLSGVLDAADTNVEVGTTYNGSWDDPDGDGSADDGNFIVKDLQSLKATVDELDGYEADTLSVHPEVDGYFRENWMSSNFQTRVIEEVNAIFDNYVVTSTMQDPTNDDTISNPSVLVADTSADNGQFSVTMERTRMDPWQTGPEKQVIPFKAKSAGFVARFSKALVTGYDIHS